VRTEQFVRELANFVGVRFVAIVSPLGRVLTSAIRGGGDATIERALIPYIARVAQSNESLLLDMTDAADRACDVQLEPIARGFVLVIASDRNRTFAYDRRRAERAAQVLARALREVSPAAPPRDGNGGMSNAPASAVVFAEHPGDRSWAGTRVSH